MSKPEPAPIARGEIVPDILIATIRRATNGPDGDDLIELIKERDSFGRQKYGQPLMTNDGRNGIEDAKQELGDLLQYLQKCKVANDDLSEFENLLTVAIRVIKFIISEGRNMKREREHQDEKQVVVIAWHDEDGGSEMWKTDISNLTTEQRSTIVSLNGKTLEASERPLFYDEESSQMLPMWKIAFSSRFYGLNGKVPPFELEDGEWVEVRHIVNIMTWA
jgi:hypothetical protein